MFESVNTRRMRFQLYYRYRCMYAVVKVVKWNVWFSLLKWTGWPLWEVSTDFVFWIGGYGCLKGLGSIQ